jgi:hypothetical protein
MTEKEQLRAMVEDLPEGEIHTVLRFVEFLRQETADPLEQALRNAPLDDEPLTAEELAELEASEGDLDEGRTVSHEEARRLLLADS